MKKTRKILSIVLAVLFAFSSMPVVYTGTAAADAVGYALGETGTLENPTKPLEATGSVTDPDAYKMLYEVYNTNYTFYQTKDDEYFNLRQVFNMKQYDDGDVKLYLQTAGLYYGETEATQDGSYEISAGYGRIEIPRITKNPTQDFVDNYLVGEANFEAANDAAANIVGEAKGLVIAGGNEPPLYTWKLPIIFKGHNSGSSGEINTGYYVKATWEWYNNDDSFGAHYEMNIGASIRVLDAREFAKELSKLYVIVENPEEYTTAYVSAAQAMLETIPDDLENLSAVYDQSVIDAYTEEMKARSLNAADYTEYNNLYANLRAITNELGGFSKKSYQAFVAEIKAIDAGLSKALDKTQQSVVDAATQALRNAYSKLVNSGHHTNGANYQETIHDINFVVGNDFKFTQIKDNQVFSYTQSWLIDRANTEDKDAPRMFYAIVDATSPFVSRFTNNSVEVIPKLQANAFSGTLTDQTVFTCWEEVLENGAVKPDTDVIDRTSSKIKSDYTGFKKGVIYYLENSPEFIGLSSAETGEHTFTFKQNIYLNWQNTIPATGIVIKNNYTNTSFTTTLTISDARQLVAIVNEAKSIIAAPGDYSDAYIASLKAATAGVPVSLLRGVEYYPQEDIDTLYNQINAVLSAGDTTTEDLADYSEYAEVLEKMMSIENSSKYTDESFTIFQDTIFTINKNLDKRLPSSEQATVDAAVQALLDAYEHLEFYEVGDDTTFSTNDITDDLGYNTLEFEVSNTEYTFMQIYDGQKFAVETELYLESTNDNYDTYIYNLEYSVVKAGDTTCADRGQSADDGCHNLENIIVPENMKFTSDFLNVVSSGVTTYDKTTTGTIGKNITWEFDKKRSLGSSFISDGIIVDGSLITTAPHYATSNAICNGFSGDASGEAEGYEAIYSWRLGWGYREKHFLDNFVNLSETTKRHVHIPVKVKLTDARALNSLYNEVGDILTGKTDKNYTFDSLVNLYGAYNATDADMANGNVYHTQAEVNEEYVKLKAAYDALEQGADYSDYFKAYVQVEEIINSGNVDSRENALYEKTAYENFVNYTTAIHEGLDKDLDESEQGTIDDATKALLDAISKLEESKLADYSRLNDAMTEAEKVLAEESANPGTYTQETLDAIQNAYNNALQNAFNNDPEIPHKELHADQQATIDAVASALEAAIADKEYKADYSEFEEAYDKVQDIVNNSDKYPDETVQAAKDALNEADKLDKDLPDTADNREEINNATDKLNEFINSLEPRANYDLYYEYLEIANSLKPSDYTGYSYGTFMKAVEEIDAGLAKNLPQSQQAIVDKAVQDLLDAYNVLVSNPDTPNVNGDNVFTEADIAGEYNGAFRFSLASTEYNFVQTVDNEKLVVKTDFTASNADTANYTIKLESLKISSLDSSEFSMDSNGNCFNAASTAVNQAENLFCKEFIDASVITGIDYTMHIDEATGNQSMADKNGDMAWYKTWENTSGVALATNGVLNDSTTLTEESSASAEYIYNIPGYSERTYTYVLRLGWSEINNATNETQHYHAHIPVTLNLVDGRDLFDLYNEVKEKVEAGNDGTYTDSSFENLENAFKDVNTDIVFGITDATQEQVNEEYEKLKAASDALSEKADYSGLEDALEDAKEIVNNPDKYTEETVKNAQDAIDAAENLNKDLEKNEENQAIIDGVIQDLIDSVTNAKEKADYSGLDEAIKNAEEIVNNPDKYTEETVKNAQDAIDAAENLNKDLEKNDENQAIIDGVIQDLIDSVINAEEKADYTDYNNAKADADNLVNDDGNGNPIYDEEAFQQYKDAVEKLDSELNKDLPKEDQEIVDKATEDLKDLRTELDASKGSEQEIIDPQTTADSIKNKVIEEGGYNPDEVIVEFKNYLGEELAGEAFVGTGSTMRVILKSTGELLEYKLFIVMGDVDGDGDIDNADYQKSMDVGLEFETYPEEHNYFFIANDVSGDGYIDVIDSALIRRIF